MAANTLDLSRQIPRPKQSNRKSHLCPVMVKFEISFDLKCLRWNFTWIQENNLSIRDINNRIMFLLSEQIFRAIKNATATLYDRKRRGAKEFPCVHFVLSPPKRTFLGRKRFWTRDKWWYRSFPCSYQLNYTTTQLKCFAGLLSRATHMRRFCIDLKRKQVSIPNPSLKPHCSEMILL